ncbi:mitogen-activated protein kinase-binding protein 1-like isoform X3 [Brienomyrus brachyistius]|uniref:mitogen-activated protein kinase-binding protein 1-like isoform X3 n=1 Tax=Brienomyrus brachyistius TaxID=42636 RepID=UPI0020B20D45|nr:mitogen-activated protein kinase-binding protein 1-like isoform X3 [Brienomyrus brachyistius]
MSEYEKNFSRPTPKAFLREFCSDGEGKKDSFRSRVKKLLHGKLSQSVNLRRKSQRSNPCRNPQNEVVLETVHGITTFSDSGLACDPHAGVVAYPAGCVVVILHPKERTQSHIVNSSRKAFTALAFSRDGKYLVTGEHGHKPCVRVWDVSKGMELAEVQCHQYGVACVAFDSSGDYVVSVGCQQDMAVSVWEWRKGVVIASNKVSGKVLTMSFSEDSSYFVTAGNRMIKFWYLDISRNRQVNSTVPLTGRSALLGEQWNSTFCGLACGRGHMAGSTYCVTIQGLLCRFNSRRLLEAWVDLKTAPAHCLSVSEDYVFCGCADATVRVFKPSDLCYITTLPHPQNPCMDITNAAEAGDLLADDQVAGHPDTLALAFDPLARYLTCVYSNHSVYVWDVRDIRNVEVVYSAHSHSNGVWSVEMYPDMEEQAEPCLTVGSFITCSSDGTIRLWPGDPSNCCSGNTGWNVCVALICWFGLPTLPASLARRMPLQDPRQVVWLKKDTEQQWIMGEPREARSSHVKPGIRVMSVSPDGLHLAAGDWSGSLRVFCLQFLHELLHIKAHDSEVLCLEFSPALMGLDLLASAGRDGCIHIFNREKGYSHEQTVCGHSASIIAIKFTGAFPNAGLLSCEGDGNVYLYTAEKGQLSCSSRIATKTTVNDMSLDAASRHSVVACQDQNIRVYSLKSGKMTKNIKSPLSDVTFLKMQTDVSGTFLATSCSNGTICIFDYSSGDCVETLFGHSDSVTGMRFSHDCRYLITVSGDSCVFVWRLASKMTKAMRKNLADIRRRTLSCSSSGTTISQLPASGPRKQTCEDVRGPLTPSKVIKRPNQEEHCENILTYSAHDEVTMFCKPPYKSRTHPAYSPHGTPPHPPSVTLTPLQKNGGPMLARTLSPQALCSVANPGKEQMGGSYQPRARWAENSNPEAVLLALETQSLRSPLTPSPGGKDAASEGDPFRHHKQPLYEGELEDYLRLACPDKQMTKAGSEQSLPGTDLLLLPCDLETWSLQTVPPEMSDHSFRPTNGSFLQSEEESLHDVPLLHWKESGVDLSLSSVCGSGIAENQASDLDRAFVGSSSFMCSFKEELRSISQGVPSVVTCRPVNGPFDPNLPERQWPSKMHSPHGSPSSPAVPMSVTPSWCKDSSRWETASRHADSNSMSANCTNTKISENILQQFRSVKPGRKYTGIKDKPKDHLMSPGQRRSPPGSSDDISRSAQWYSMGPGTSPHAKVLHNSSEYELVRPQVKKPDKLISQRARSTPILNASKEHKECLPVSTPRKPPASTDKITPLCRHVSRAGSRPSSPVCRVPSPLGSLTRKRVTVTQRSGFALPGDESGSEAQQDGARHECSTKSSSISHSPKVQPGGTWSCGANASCLGASMLLSDPSSAHLEREGTVEVKSNLHSYSHTSSPGDAMPTLALPKESTISSSVVRNEPSGLNTCKQIVRDLKHSVTAAVGLYRKCLSQGSPAQCSQMRLLLDDVFSEVRSDLSCAFNSESSQDQGRVTTPRNTEAVALQLQSDGIVALLERYSEILVRITARKANSV